MTDRLRVALAGCHRMLSRKPSNHNWAAAFAAVPETETVAIFDYGAQTRADFIACWGEIPAYDDYTRMLQEVQPDLVCLATRQTMHADQCELALAAGVRGILSDKPLVTSLSELDRILNACQRHNVPLAFGLDRRWMANYHHLRQAIADGIIGSVTGLVVYGLPNLINHGCHWYDAALLLLDDPEPSWVSGLVDDISADPAESRRHLDPPGRGQVGLDNGVVIYFTSAGGKRPSFEVLGEQGRLIILDDAKTAYIWASSDGSSQPSLRPLPLPDMVDDWPAGPAAVRDLVQTVQTGGQTACDVEQARRATELGFAFHLSHARDGARIPLPATDRTLLIPSFPWGNEKDEPNPSDHPLSPQK